MYTIITCPECEHTQIIKDNPETTRCRQCGTTNKFRKLVHQYQTEDPDIAKKARTLILSKQNDTSTGFQSASDLSTQSYSEEEMSTLFDEWTEHANTKLQSNTSQSKKDKVTATLSELEPVSEEHLQDTLNIKGINPQYTMKILNKLEENGSIIRTRDGTIRSISAL